jgi:hypothetical protein
MQLKNAALKRDGLSKEASKRTSCMLHRCEAFRKSLNTYKERHFHASSRDRLTSKDRKTSFFGREVLDSKPGRNQEDALRRSERAKEKEISVLLIC